MLTYIPRHSSLTVSASYSFSSPPLHLSTSIPLVPKQSQRLSLCPGPHPQNVTSRSHGGRARQPLRPEKTREYERQGLLTSWTLTSALDVIRYIFQTFSRTRARQETFDYAAHSHRASIEKIISEGTQQRNESNANDKLPQSDPAANPAAPMMQDPSDDPSVDHLSQEPQPTPGPSSPHEANEAPDPQRPQGPSKSPIKRQKRRKKQKQEKEQENKKRKLAADGQPTDE